MRIPRKLKKGCRTLRGNPRTKWQRKGRLHITKTLAHIADAACSAAIGMDLLQQALEKIHPMEFSHGGVAESQRLQDEFVAAGAPTTGEVVMPATDYKLIPPINKNLCKYM